MLTPFVPFRAPGVAGIRREEVDRLQGEEQHGGEEQAIHDLLRAPGEDVEVGSEDCEERAGPGQRPGVQEGSQAAPALTGPALADPSSEVAVRGIGDGRGRGLPGHEVDDAVLWL